MKQTLLLIGVALTLAACGPAKMVEENREINNFTCNQGSVSWTYIYNYDPAQYGAIREWFDMNFNISKETDKTLIGETNRSALPVTAAGYSRMAVANIFLEPCTVYFRVDFKEDRYRVVVNNIIWYPQTAITVYGVTQGAGTMDLNEVALKRGEYRPTFYELNSVHLNGTLYHLFTARPGTMPKDDW